ncbi:hypothetical protein PHAVU_L001676 [Phaseolus vulgaris]|uniref:Uncharacterized protein n=2 Tax=Phaseolus vulgaris TaxID=3885 RepID=A0ACC3P1S1_PHAVU|nr:hypothetical protein PHAVU_007G132100g [Phaseolus vulgaris]ESW16135.1 hypothetical protein PHAVU_007G132100g [Phaseolus vulgaris]
MEFVNRIVDIAARAANNNTFINVCLLASFATLGVRSMNQQWTIEALEAEKESLAKSNKSIRRTIWNWKQQLYAEASTDSSVVPLARLKAIYGEGPPPPYVGDTGMKDAESSGTTKIIA